MTRRPFVGIFAAAERALVAAAVLLACPGCAITYLMWDSVGRDNPKLVAVRVQGTELRGFDVLYVGDLYRHTVLRERPCPKEEGDAKVPHHHWETAVVVEPTPIDEPASGTVMIPEWNAYAYFAWTSEEGNGELRIRERIDDGKSLLVGAADGHVPWRGASAGQVILASLATPITVAVDVVLLPVYVIFGVLVIVTGGPHG